MEKPQSYHDPGRPLMLYEQSMGVRRKFIRKVYLILSVQLLVTGVISGILYSWLTDPKQSSPSNSYPVHRLDGSENSQVDGSNNIFAARVLSDFGRRYFLWCLIGGLIGVVCCSFVMCCLSFMVRKAPGNWILLSALTFFMSVLLGAICAKYSVFVILITLGITVVLFIALTLYATFTKTDFTGCGPYLLVFFLVIIIFSFVFGIISGALGNPGTIKLVHTIVSFCFVLLFSMYIVYETQKIMGGKRQEYSVDDYVIVAIGLYMDVVNLFLSLLGLVGDS